MNDPINLTTPFAEILPQMVRSVMFAMADVVEIKNSKGKEGMLDHAINRHFSWLTTHSKPGIDRHLFDGSTDGTTAPLLKKDLRYYKSKAPAALRDILERGQSIPNDEDDWLSRFVQSNATRISKVIMHEMDAWSRYGNAQARNAAAKKAYILPSPLRVAQRILTDPSNPGSTEYSYLALRNFLIETLNVNAGEAKFASFGPTDLSSAIDFFWTYMRPRYHSTGQDNIQTRPGSFDRFLGDFLGLRGIFDLFFKDRKSAISFLSSGEFLPKASVGKKNYEFTRRKGLRSLPEVGELSNQIWGLPIPIRGADIIFRGGMKFPTRKGLVVALHGGAGAGKTSFALGLGASLSGFGIKTYFFTAEEEAADLRARSESLLPSGYRKLSFVPQSTEEWLEIFRPNRASYQNDAAAQMDKFENYLNAIEAQLKEKAQASSSDDLLPKSPCRIVVVLDGVHDLVSRGFDQSSTENPNQRERFERFIERCKSLEALVILTAGDDWHFGSELDYLVDTAIRLTHDTSLESGAKPERLVTLKKARHQLCSAGTHGLLISGSKGVRFTPQINFCLDVASIWSPRLSDASFEKDILCRVARFRKWSAGNPQPEDILDFPSVKLYRSSNIFINGHGSGGKAGMALKMAASPYSDSKTGKISPDKERILIVSFLYPEDYYENLHGTAKSQRAREYQEHKFERNFSRIHVIQFYPGHLQPMAFFNRIRWEVEKAELDGDPYTSVILDGLHNVFIQFPELETHKIVWPQLYSMLRTRDVSIITTHSVLMLATFDEAGSTKNTSVDDHRSEPLRHALVQKTDFSFEVDSVQLGFPTEQDQKSTFYRVNTLSAIGQPLPDAGNELYWHREKSFFFGRKHSDQHELPLK